MDVSAPRLSDPHEVSSRRFAPVGPPERPLEAPTSPQGVTESLRWEPRSSLKFSLAAADVDLKFEIHEGTSRVTMTMYERESGEILREFPSPYVLGVIASLASIGLFVDTAS